MAEINIVGQLYSDFLVIIQNCVIKYKNIADENETIESKKAGDGYVVAKRKEDTFATYYHYRKELIDLVCDWDTAYKTKEAMIDAYYDNKRLIPYEYREELLRRQRQYIIDSYEERNNYYRMLNGLPNIEDTDFLYVDKTIGAKYIIDTETPIHLLDESKISVLYAIGYIDELYEKTQKAYLKFLGKLRIPYEASRPAYNFSILRAPDGINDSTWDMFVLIYDQCREYFMSCIYVTEHRQTIPYYDNFIAMAIMLYAILQVIARLMKTNIDRDFFDEYCMKALFSVYGVPYFNNVDDNIKKQILQSINLLIQNKGTNKVIYDIASILGFNRLNVYKYYLVRDQKFNSAGHPIIAYKENPEDPDNPELDYEKMYNIYFQKVDLNDMDAYQSLKNPVNKVEYKTITTDDPYWVEDTALMKEMYETAYNFVETKYMGVSISYRLSRMLFENSYLLKMIFDKKDELADVNLNLPKILPFVSVTLFDAIVALCALVCKVNHLKGEVIVDPSKILHVIGFNFKEDFELIRKEILENPYVDDSIADFFSDPTAYTADKLNNLYNRYISLYEIVVDKMASTDRIEVYNAYNKIYRTFFYQEDSQEMFKIGESTSGPVYASTFNEYLEYMNPELYSAIKDAEEKDLNLMINHICGRLKSYISNLEYLGVIMGSSEEIENMLLTMIRFFKSYTTDLISFDIIYLLDIKPELLLRLIEKVTLTTYPLIQEKIYLGYSDIINLKSFIHLYNNTKIPFLKDGISKMISYILLSDKDGLTELKDSIHHIAKEISMRDTDFSTVDIISNFENTVCVNDANFSLRDAIRDIIFNIPLNEIFISFEKIKHIIEEIFMRETNFSMVDIITTFENTICVNDANFSLRDSVKIITT